MEIWLSRIYMVSGLVLERYVDDKGCSEDRNEFRPVVGFRKLAFPLSVGNIRTMCSLSPNRGLRRSGWLVGYPEVILRPARARQDPAEASGESRSKADR